MSMRELRSYCDTNYPARLVGKSWRAFWLRRRLSFVIAAVLIVAGTARIASTYTIFSQTFDEQSHLACGMEWLDKGTYRLEAQHPPLSRVAIALGPFIDGCRSPSDNVVADTARNGELPDLFISSGNLILSEKGYAHTLALARLGPLPFFVLSCWLLWIWTRKLFGTPTALASLLIFTNLPCVLAHAGLATTDFCFTATFLLAIYSFSGWLQRPSLRSGAFGGFGLALAILTKFSVFLFFPASAVAIVVVRVFLERRFRLSNILPSRDRLRTLPIYILICTLTIWAGYRFSFAPIVIAKARPHQNISRILGGSKMAVAVANVFVEMPVPNPELYQGLMWLSAHARGKNPTYLLGQVKDGGYWDFFPVTILVKTPIAVLLLAVLGIWFLVTRQPDSAISWHRMIPLASFLPILAICMISPINLGIRHILPIFPFVSMLAGVGAAELLRSRKDYQLTSLLGVTLVLWLMSSSALSHPDYLAYFNELAGTEPQKIIVDSDLDWGQDLPRLRKALNEKKVNSFCLGYWGSADLSKQDLPPFTKLKPYVPCTGWVAISLTRLEFGGRPFVAPRQVLAYDWLKVYQPDSKIGRSMFLYNVPERQ